MSLVIGFSINNDNLQYYGIKVCEINYLNAIVYDNSDTILKRYILNDGNNNLNETLSTDKYKDIKYYDYDNFECYSEEEFLNKYGNYHFSNNNCSIENGKLKFTKVKLEN